MTGQETGREAGQCVKVACARMCSPPRRPFTSRVRDLPQEHARVVSLRSKDNLDGDAAGAPCCQCH